MEIRKGNSTMRIILGGSGFIGLNFKSGVKLSSSDVNLLSYSDTIKCFEKYKPNTIIHSACKKLNSKLMYQNGADYFDENVRMSLNIFKAAKEIKVKRIIVIASINAFFENNPLLSSDSYNHNVKKVLSDEYYKQYGLQSNVFFVSNVYGPLYKDTNNGFIPFIIKKCHNAIVNDTDIDIEGNPNYTRNFIFVEDIIKIIESSENNIGHVTIANNNYFSLNQVVSKVTQIMSFKNKVNWYGNFDEVENKTINIESRNFNDTNFTSLRDGLNKTIKWYLKNEK
jgi:nucleoside-diphosphate-sugar epimerase